MTAKYIVITVKIQYELKMRNIIFWKKIFLIFLPLEGTLEKYIFTNNLYISDVYFIYLNRRDVIAT